MASPVTDNDTWFKVKRINFFGRTIPIILQNQNGPCPLLAICNVLSMRTNLDLKPSTRDVSQDTLLQLVGNQIIQGNFSSNAEDQDRILSLWVDLVPKLTTGLDVNVKFTRIDDFEFTAEREIFDLLGIPLYHGWLVDPQDRDTAEALGSKSYNTLMDELTHLDAPLEIENESGKNNEEDTESPVDIVDATTESLGVSSTCVSSGQSLGESPQKKKKWDIAVEPNLRSLAGDDTHSEIVEPAVTDRSTLIIDDSIALGSDHVKKTGSDSISQKPEMERHDPKEADSAFKFTESGSFQHDCVKKASSGLLASTADSDLLIHKVDEPESSTANVDINELVCEREKRQGKLVKNFMDNNASQLTVFGLSCLRNEIEEQKPCVLFRNNHFNTMIKFEGELYTLATDEVFLEQRDLVWEKLNEVSGNTLFVTGDFKELKSDNRSNSSWNEPKAITTAATVSGSQFWTGESEELDPFLLGLWGDLPKKGNTGVSGSQFWTGESKELDPFLHDVWDDLPKKSNTGDKPASVKDESQENSSSSDDLQSELALKEMENEQALQEMENEQQGNSEEPTMSDIAFRLTGRRPDRSS